MFSGLTAKVPRRKQPATESHRGQEGHRETANHFFVESFLNFSREASRHRGFASKLSGCFSPLPSLRSRTMRKKQLGEGPGVRVNVEKQ